MGAHAIELQLGIGLNEVVVRANLDRSVAHALDAQSDALAPGVQLDDTSCALDGDNGTGLLLVLVDSGWMRREHIVGGDGQEGAVQGLFEIAILGGDWVVDGDLETLSTLLVQSGYEG
jgi:hypothetical protein